MLAGRLLCHLYPPKAQPFATRTISPPAIPAVFRTATPHAFHCPYWRTLRQCTAPFTATWCIAGRDQTPGDIWFCFPAPWVQRSAFLHLYAATTCGALHTRFAPTTAILACAAACSPIPPSPSPPLSATTSRFDELDSTFVHITVVGRLNNRRRRTRTGITTRCLGTRRAAPRRCPRDSAGISAKHSPFRCDIHPSFCGQLQTRRLGVSSQNRKKKKKKKKGDRRGGRRAATRAGGAGQGLVVGGSGMGLRHAYRTTTVSDGTTDHLCASFLHTAAW